MENTKFQQMIKLHRNYKMRIKALNLRITKFKPIDDEMINKQL